ncbi:uncharacterized protein [Amphiura filiformis]|uniref:uncharacterized protein n=1 Tax=Amphiura filiformis TaxID=82378 RepID=UPI003B21F148
MLSACCVAQPCCWTGSTNAATMQSPKEWKLCFVGDPGVGKTSIGIRYKHNQFHEKQTSTVGAAFFSVDVTVDGELHRLNTWDTAGQERYRSLAPLYYRNTQAVVMVYSVSKYDTYQNVTGAWLQSIRAHTDDDVLIIIVGNKLDTAQEHREVETEEAQRFAADIEAEFFETSAKTGDNIDELFTNIARRLKALNNTRQARRNYSITSTSSTRSTNSLSETPEHRHSAGCCR